MSENSRRPTNRHTISRIEFDRDEAGKLIRRPNRVYVRAASTGRKARDGRKHRGKKPGQGPRP